jgi:BirA family biotin operon repressor/biotin-[acetyl-CoA-carboxylase] ligase
LGKTDYFSRFQRTIMVNVGSKIHWLESVDSTNEELSRWLARDPGIREGTVLIAREQHSGRGTGGNSWLSEAGENLTCSFLLRPAFLAAPQQFYLNMAVSLAIHAAVRVCLPDHQVRIKWPNDIYVNNWKIAGILIRNSVSGNSIDHMVVGVGLNVNQTVFPAGIPHPGSLKLAGERPFDMEQVLEELLKQLNFQINRIERGDLQGCAIDYRKALFGFGRWLKFRYGGRELKARIYGTTESGQLLLETRDKERLECDMKEIEYLF